MALRADGAGRRDGRRQRAARRAAAGRRRHDVGLGAARADGDLPRAAADRRLRGPRRRRGRRGAADERGADRRRRADAALLRPDRRPDRLLRAPVRPVPARPLRAGVHRERGRPGHGDAGPVAVLARRLPGRRRRATSSSCCCPTSWPTSGSATPSRRPTGATCGSTSRSPRTASGCGWTTSASSTSTPRPSATWTSASVPTEPTGTPSVGQPVRLRALRRRRRRPARPARRSSATTRSSRCCSAGWPTTTAPRARPPTSSRSPRRSPAGRCTAFFDDWLYAPGPPRRVPGLSARHAQRPVSASRSLRPRRRPAIGRAAARALGGVGGGGGPATDVDADPAQRFGLPPPRVVVDPRQRA